MMVVNTFPIIIQNNSGLDLAKHKIYVNVVGINNSSPNGQQFYDLKKNAWYSKQDFDLKSKAYYTANLLTDLKQVSGAASKYVVDMPYIKSGIVYLSIDKPLVFNGTSSPSISTTAQNLSFQTNFSFFEVTYLKSQGYPYIDTSNVDSFDMSFSIKETLANGKTTSTLGFTDSRLVILDQLINQLQGNGSWQQLIQQDHAGNVIRVVSPQKANNPSPTPPLTQNFDASFYAAYIDKVWEFYKHPAHSLTVSMAELGYANVTYVGKVNSNNQLYFYNVHNPAQQFVAVTRKPKTSSEIKNSIFGISDLLPTPNKTRTSIANKNLGAAFNLGLLADPQYPNLDLTPASVDPKTGKKKGWAKYADQFYKQTFTTSEGETIAAYNVYAGALQNASVGGIYGFPYADVLNQSSTVAAPNAQSATVALQHYQEVNLIKGKSGNSYLYGNSSSKSFIIYGDWGSDTLEGNDTLIGNSKEDSIYGEDGDDRLGGLLGNDTLHGGGGNDYLNGGGGLDTLIGGGGGDVYIVDSTIEKVIESANQGVDTVRSFVSYSLGANLERLSLQTTANINATGNNLNNLLVGNSGNNLLNGQGGNDTLTGNAGNDVLVGASGNDILIGGTGNDSYNYFTGTAFVASAIGLDQIANFSRLAGNIDKIKLSRTTFNSGTNFASVTTDALAATSAAHITFSTSTGHLFYNQNGSTAGLGTGGHFATLSDINGNGISGANTLLATDFVAV
jgi:Beta-1,3-glucanase/RTX calcium-binding nonapeptide repeat (4 copies)